MGEKKIAPDSELWAKSLTPEQQLFIITVWNEGGRAGFTEMMLFVFDEWEALNPEQRRQVAERAAEQFFSEKAFDEFEKYQCRERYQREVEKQAAEAGDKGNGNGSLIVDPFK